MKQPNGEGVTIEAVWRDLAARGAEENGGVADHLRRFEGSAAGILEELKALEAAALASDDPLVFLRRETADRLDRRISSGVLQGIGLGPEALDGGSPSMESLDLLIADLEVQIAALRAYCRRRFGDGLENGWFPAYRALSTLFHERMREDRHAAPADAFRFEGRSWRFTRKDFQECRKRCLTAAVDRPFDPVERVAGAG